MRILLIRLREIGDVVFTTPAVGALRRRYPDAHITYLVEPAAEPVVRHNPHLDEIVVAPRSRGTRGLAAEFGLIRRLRGGRFDLVVDFHGGPRASILAWLTGARVRVGYEVRGRAWMYTRLVPRARELRARHSVENQWDLIAALGVAPPARDTDPIEMPLDSPSVTAVERRLQAAGVSADHRLLVMHVSAGNPFRRWPAASFAAVAATLARDQRCRIVITSGPSERDAAARVIDEARSRMPEDAHGRLLDYGDLSLSELRALVERAAMYIGGDSGPMHIASASNVPIVALYGPTLPARSAPWRESAPAEAVEVAGLPCRPCDQRTCEPGDFRCLGWITPEQVVASARRISRIW
jgi:predicted lipopolysaccharide heptosyltransferase III